MGADIYLNSIYDRLEEQYRPLMNQINEDMKKWEQNSIEHENLRLRWLEYYDILHTDDSYFRDSYNSSSLLWQLDLSWWGDVIPRLNDGGNLNVEGCQWLLDQINLPDNLAKLQKPSGLNDWEKGTTIEELVAYFMKKHARLCNILRKAIELQEGLYCSL